MKLLEFKKQLESLNQLTFTLPDGSLVPTHFHVTEVGRVSKHFIDCGGVERKEDVVNFQLWSANDYNHKLHPEKLLDIINLFQEKLIVGDLEIEVEYQAETIGKYGIDFKDGSFKLTQKLTACLAEDACGIPAEKPRIRVSTNPQQNTCTPGSGCC